MRFRRRITEKANGQVFRLYRLVHVERDMAMKTTGPDDQYAYGRLGGYHFVITAMEMYWPDLVAEGDRLRNELEEEHNR